MPKRLITDSFQATKRSGRVNKSLRQKKTRNEPLKKADRRILEYKDAKDVNDLKILRDFDLRCEFGPCIGISRLERWQRAKDHDLEPPSEVEEILKAHENNTKYSECIWYDEELI